MNTLSIYIKDYFMILPVELIKIIDQLFTNYPFIESPKMCTIRVKQLIKFMNVISFSFSSAQRHTLRLQ